MKCLSTLLALGQSQSTTWTNDEYEIGSFSRLKKFDQNDVVFESTGEYADELEQIKGTYRLQRNANGEHAHVPFHYSVNVRMGGLREEDRNEEGYFEFAASANIAFTHNTDSKYIVLSAGNNPGFTVEEVNLSCGVSSYATEFEHYKEKELLIVSFTDDIEIGETCMLDIESTSYLAYSNTGFYQSSYIDQNGDKHWMATTQFESTGARKMFVCFDEPDRKARFNFTVEYQYDEYDAIFNTLPHERRVNGNTNYVDFDETMIMSPYLLALVISEYQTEAVTDTSPETNTLIRVHAPEYINNDKLGEYGLAAAGAIIDGFSEYFGFNYADAFAPDRAKSDQIGIPDFAAGAMENWGLVTYQYYLIYVNDVDYAESAVASVAEVVAHELTHQWTGNLITCDWWDEIWINEAFADIGGYLGLRYAEPTWNWESEFTVHELFGALRADATTSSRPLINKQNNGGAVVESPQQINRQFDGIAYAKGGSINRMVMQAMEERRWQSGMRDYLNVNKYTATNGEIYFDHMQTSLEENAPTDPEWDLPYPSFNQTFDCWHRQMGYPIIMVEAKNGVLNLSQERFLHRGNRSQLAEPASSLDYRWNVPITYVNKAGEYKLEWMTTADDLSIRGYAGADIWLDPESTAFGRFHFGSFSELSETITNMIKRNVGGLPSNYFMSIAKMISDQFYIYSAEIDYGTDIWHLMETTRLVATHQLASNH